MTGTASFMPVPPQNRVLPAAVLHIIDIMMQIISSNLGRRRGSNWIMRPGMIVASVMCAALLTACASNLPREIREAPPGNPPVAAVRADMQQYIGAKVRWGGTIAAVENLANETRIEIVARDLDRSGQPLATDRSTGRFIAVMDGFLDPALYAEDREITIAGTVESETTRKIGEYDYSFPVVRARTYLLWAERYEPQPGDYPPYWYYDPWYPWHPFYYPYYPYRPYHRHPVPK